MPYPDHFPKPSAKDYGGGYDKPTHLFAHPSHTCIALDDNTTHITVPDITGDILDRVSLAMDKTLILHF